MPKVVDQAKTDLNQQIMAQIRSGTVKMKPRWYFVLGSVLMTLSMIGTSVGLLFLINLALFLSRQHGPRGEWRLQLMLASFPWWLPIATLLGVGLSLWLLRKYDFSYRRNFALIVSLFFLSILLASALIDISGLNELWFRQGPMRRWYQSPTQSESFTPPRRGQGRHNLRNQL